MNSFYLYSTDGCHLCEQALELISLVDPTIQVKVLDIMDDPSWLETFQIRIPVLENPQNNTQLDWPFNAEQLTQYFKQNA